MGPSVRRPTHRRSFDFYWDQLHWLNRTRHHIQEHYGQLVSANAMVRLALDLLIADHKRRGHQSKLIIRLVRGR